MKLSYMVATPDVHNRQVTAWRGDMTVAADRLVHLGYDGVELMVARPSEVNADVIARTFARRGLAVSLVCTGELFGQEGLELSHPDADLQHRAEEELGAAIRLAAELGTDVNIGRLRGRLHDAGSRDRATAAIARAARLADSCGVNVLLEPLAPHVADWLHNLDEGVEFVGQLGLPALGVMADVAHIAAAGGDVAAELRRHAGNYSHIHVCESDRRAPGSDGYDWESIVKALHDTAYGGYLSAELGPEIDHLQAMETTMDTLGRTIGKLLLPDQPHHNV